MSQQDLSGIVQHFLNESKLSSKEREQLSDEDFALPKERRFPIHDKVHVQKAIQYFHKADESKRKTIATNIKRAAERLDVHIGTDTLIHKYI